MRAIFGLVILLHICNAFAADEPAANAELQGIDDQVQTLKKEVIQINHELSLLEEKLLFPSTTQISVFLALEAPQGFRLDSAELSIDNQIVAKYVYTFRELEALYKGGVQRLHTGNVASGTHKVSVLVRGKNSGGDSFEQTATADVKKDVNPKFVEMRIVAAGGAPKVQFKDW
ncbi:MAG TPA: hypothetical protein VGL10_02980 [Gammaproteobacteria bacterium]